jgi:hypothetical protein
MLVTLYCFVVLVVGSVVFLFLSGYHYSSSSATNAQKKMWYIERLARTYVEGVDKIVAGVQVLDAIKVCYGDGTKPRLGHA